MSGGGRRLWDKGGALNTLVHRFTVGDDPVWDAHLIEADCLGSAAHARTLERAGLLSRDEVTALIASLAEIRELAGRGAFVISAELEDVHTAIEAHLTRECGAAGEKIHTGRSRNDQVATAMRLYMRRQTLTWIASLDALLAAVLDRIERDGDVPMPGYTHLQPAMPSSIGQWLHALAEGLAEQTRACLDLLDRLDRCPLGTGAGFGVPLPLDRAFTASLLGFSRVQRSPIDVQNSRGRMERYFVRVASDIASVIEKLACDMLLYATAEFGFLRLPAALTTGSSIMPQKQNPDVLELMRAHAARLRAAAIELELITARLPSSYHRDLQLTKRPAIRSAIAVCELLQVAGQVLASFEPDRERLAAAMRPELFATEAALRRVQQGEPFRQAYRQVADDIAAGRFNAPQPTEAALRAARVSVEVLRELRDETSLLRQRGDALRARVDACEGALLDPGRG
jgi:argininosuccinate lyase